MIMRPILNTGRSLARTMILRLSRNRSTATDGWGRSKVRNFAVSLFHIPPLKKIPHSRGYWAQPILRLSVQPWSILGFLLFRYANLLVPYGLAILRCTYCTTWVSLVKSHGIIYSLMRRSLNNNNISIDLMRLSHNSTNYGGQGTINKGDIRGYQTGS